MRQLSTDADRRIKDLEAELASSRASTAALYAIIEAQSVELIRREKEIRVLKGAASETIR